MNAGPCRPITLFLGSLPSFLLKSSDFPLTYFRRLRVQSHTVQMKRAPSTTEPDTRTEAKDRNKEAANLSYNTSFSRDDETCCSAFAENYIHNSQHLSLVNPRTLLAPILSSFLVHELDLLIRIHWALVAVLRR